MKKSLLLVVSFFTCLNLFAQPACVPGTLTAPQSGYIIPDSATGFAHACAGMYYEQIIYIKAPLDTAVTFNSIPITADVDSFVVDKNIIGLPSYLTAVTVPGTVPPSPPNPKTNFERLIIPGDSLACVKISGNVPASQVAGAIPLTINIRAYFSGIPLIGTIDTPASVGYYEIIVDAPNTGVCFPANVSDLNSLIANIQIAPNPAQDFFHLAVDARAQEEVLMKLLDFQGKVVHTQKINLRAGTNHLDVPTSSFARGMYMINLSSSKLNLNRKLQLR